MSDQGCDHPKVYPDGICAGCGAMATDFPGLGTPHKMIPRPGTSFTPRPKATDPDVIRMAAEAHAGALMNLCDGLERHEAISALVEILASGEADGYQRAKRLEEQGWDVDFELAEFLNDDVDVDAALRKTIAEWVEAESITCAFQAGETVSIPHRSDRVVGEITGLRPEVAQAVVFVEALGHVRAGVGTHGRIVNFEDMLAVVRA